MATERKIEIWKGLYVVTATELTDDQFRANWLKKYNQRSQLSDDQQRIEHSIVRGGRVLQRKNYR
jgi:hypothetical protein